MDSYLVITDSTGKVLVGESASAVYDPYSRATVATPTEVLEYVGQTEVPITVGGGSATGAGKIAFEPLVISKRVDRISQTLFAAHAAGTPFKYVDLLLCKNGQTGTSSKPFLSYRLGTAYVSQIDFSGADDTTSEKISFVFGQFQIGYQVQNPDGSLGTFTPTGWDVVKNVKI